MAQVFFCEFCQIFKHPFYSAAPGNCFRKNMSCTLAKSLKDIEQHERLIKYLATDIEITLKAGSLLTF